jgi:hypothetical protein
MLQLPQPLRLWSHVTLRCARRVSAPAARTGMPSPTGPRLPPLPQGRSPALTADVFSHPAGRSFLRFRPGAHPPRSDALTPGGVHRILRSAGRSAAWTGMRSPSGPRLPSLAQGRSPALTGACSPTRPPTPAEPWVGERGRLDRDGRVAFGQTEEAVAPHGMTTSPAEAGERVRPSHGPAGENPPGHGGCTAWTSGGRRGSAAGVPA